jgi:hypothetical protein
MSTQHTPGPWAVRTHWSNKEAFEVYPTHGGNDPDFGEWSAIVEVGDCQYEEESEANALLIAAAPDLLNAVRFLLSNPDNRISKADRDAAYAAIAKATGGAA